MSTLSPERNLFSPFRRTSEDSPSGQRVLKLTQLARAVGAAALLTMAAGCGDVLYAPNGRRLPGQSNLSPDAGDGSSIDGPRMDGGGQPDVGVARDGAVDAGPEREDAGPRRDAGPSRDAGPGRDAGADNDGGGVPREDGGGIPDSGAPDGGERLDGGSTDGGDGGIPPECPVETCQEGIGACEATGRIVYDADCNPTDCDAAEGAPAPEEDCENGLDDDCDGVLNNGCVCDDGETQACYTGGEDTRNRGACHDGNLSCVDGLWTEDCEGEVIPEPEICGNGVDEDCDVNTDEGCGEGLQCFAGEGACRTAGLTRADGTCDAVPGDPAASDACEDGIDNNCRDGIDEGCVCPVDATQDCYQGDEATRGVGVCRDGLQTCIEGRRWSPGCDGQILPSAEECDTVDNDCDSVTDEGCPCSNDQAGVCTRAGTIQPDGTCDAPHVEPGTEICNGADDNCNGATDETFPEEDQPCTVGQGACENSGSVICTDPELGAHCSVLPGTPQAEECNDGIDDDCNGVSDEGCPCTVGFGICEAPGVINEAGSCEGATGDPAPETCNGLDDNCNGETDETFPEEGLCTVGIGACERSGLMVCEPGSPGGDTHCNVEAGASEPESCNGVDDDCDGVIDQEDTSGCTIFYRDVDGDTYGRSESRCLCSAADEFTAARDGDCADEDGLINPEAAEAVDNTDNNCNVWIDESAVGYDAMCDETGGSANVTPNGQPAVACSGERPSMVSIPADLLSTAVYNTRFGADGQRRAVLVTLVPSGAPSFDSISAQNTSTDAALSVGPTSCPADLPAAPPGRETRCYRSPDEPGGIATPVRFSITP